MLQVPFGLVAVGADLGLGALPPCPVGLSLGLVDVGLSFIQSDLRIGVLCHHPPWS